MHHHAFLATALGFALQGAERHLAEEEEERCLTSCDEGHDSHCDEQDAAGQYTLSCDMHPTTGCDANCRSFPSPPPTVPWMGASGTYPSPPPPPPPPDEVLLIGAWVYFAVALFIFCFVLLCSWYRRRGESRDVFAFWCCCLVPLFRERRSRWEGGGGGDIASREKATPPALLLSER